MLYNNYESIAIDCFKINEFNIPKYHCRQVIHIGIVHQPESFILGQIDDYVYFILKNKWLYMTFIILDISKIKTITPKRNHNPSKTLKIMYCKQLYAQSFKSGVSISLSATILYYSNQSLKNSKLKQITPEMYSTPNKTLKMIYYKQLQGKQSTVEFCLTICGRHF